MARKLNDAELCDKLNANAPLRERIESLLLAVEDESGDLREANATEMRIIDEMLRLGRESLTAWAQGLVVKTSAEVRQAASAQTPHWFRGNRECSPLRRATAPETSGGLVASSQCRIHVGLASESRQPPVGNILEQSYDARCLSGTWTSL